MDQGEARFKSETELPAPVTPPATLPIFEVVESGSAWAPELGGQRRALTPDARPSKPRAGVERATRVVEVSVQTLSENMASFVNGVAAMLAAGTRTAGAYEVDSVEIGCQISGTGRIGFIGTGIDVQGSSTIRMIFRKRGNASANE